MSLSLGWVESDRRPTLPLVSNPNDNYFPREDVQLDDSSSTPPIKSMNTATDPSLSAIVQVTMNIDILREIFTHFDIDLQDPTQTDTSTHKALLQACRTCKTWSVPALDVLWTALPSWIPLLSLFSTFQLLSDGRYVLRGDITEDMEHFKTYACRVRSLCIGSDDTGSQISPHVFVRLAKYQNPNSPLLPALTHLHFPNCTTPTPAWDGVFLAVSQSLRSISIDKIARPSNDFISSLISACTCDSPNIQGLTFDGDLALESTRDITKFQHLRSLLMKTYSSVDSTFLRNLGKLPHLVDLTIRMPDDVSSLFTIWAPRFDALQRLHIIGPAFSVHKLLKCVYPKKLQNLTLSAIVLPSENRDNWKECFELVADMTSLKALSVVQAGDSGAGLSLAFDQLSSLCLSKRVLRELILKIASLDVSDEDIYSLAYSLPQLRILHLPKPSTSQFNARLPTFQSLRTLSLLCPHLESLAISVQSSVIPTIIPALHLHALRELTINTIKSEWSMSQMISISHFIYTAFPNSEVADNRLVNTYDSWTNTFTQSGEIRGLISAYQSIHAFLILPASEALAAELAELWARKKQSGIAS